MTVRLSSRRRSGSRQSSQQCQVHVDRFFFDIQGIVHKEFVPLIKPSMASFTVRFWSAWRGAFGANLQTMEEQQLVSQPWQCARPQITRCSTISDFRKHYSDSQPPLPYSPDLAPATSSYSPTWNCGWKGVVLTRLVRSTQNRKRLSTHSYLRTSRDAWNHGEQRWDRCIHAQGDYFEGDGGN